MKTTTLIEIINLDYLESLRLGPCLLQLPRFYAYMMDPRGADRLFHGFVLSPHFC